MDERDQSLEGGRVALSPLQQQTGRLGWMLADATILMRPSRDDRLDARFMRNGRRLAPFNTSSS